MKKIILLGFSIFSLGYLFGQVQMTPSTVDTTISATTFDLEVDAIVKNLDKKAISVTWTRTVINLPKGWDTYICSGLNCYPPETATGTFNVGAGGTSPLFIHFSPNQVNGNAIVTVTITDNADPLNTVTSMFNITANGATATNNISPNAISLYPNPTVNYFMIQNKSGVSKVLLSNLVGKQVKSFNNNQDKFDVSDLTGGMYIVQLVDNKNKVIKTSRLSIQRP